MSSGVALHSRLVISALTITLLPEPGGARDQQVGHLGEVDGHRLARHVAAERERERGARAAEVHLVQDPPQRDDVELLVRDLDADRALARDRRLDPDAPGGQGHRQVVGQRLDPADLDVRRRLDLVLGDDGPRVAADDAGVDVEALELLDDPGLVPRVDGVRGGAGGGRRQLVEVEQLDRRQHPRDRLAAGGRVRGVGDVRRIAERGRRDRHRRRGRAAGHAERRDRRGRGRGVLDAVRNAVAAGVVPQTPVWPGASTAGTFGARPLRPGSAITPTPTAAAAASAAFASAPFAATTVSAARVVRSWRVVPAAFAARVAGDRSARSGMSNAISSPAIVSPSRITNAPGVVSSGSSRPLRNRPIRPPVNSPENSTSWIRPRIPT